MPLLRADLPLAVDRAIPHSLPAQIAAQVRALINDGALKPGDALPGTRRLAEQLGVSRGSVTTAFDQLHAEGYLHSSPGAPTRVNPELLTPPPEPARTRPQLALPRPKIRISLKPSTASPQNVRPAAWRAAWRQAAGVPEKKLEQAGQPELREAIAEHIRLTRSMALSSRSVLVTGGSREGFMLILMALSDAYGRPLTVGVEDPGHPGLRGIITLLGHATRPCATDSQGVLVDALPSDLDVLLVTPSYQYPLGSTMPAARRAELIQWANARGTVVVEDDFNAELRYRLAPEPALAALGQASTAQVIVLGTFSTLLSPSLSAGYVLAPPSLVDGLLATRAQLGMPVAGVTQRAIAQLLYNGYVRKHTKAMHARLGRRKATIARTLRPEGVEITTMGSGADYFFGFADSERAASFEKRLLEQGIGLGHAEKLWSTIGPEQGFILSFAHLEDEEFAFALGAVADALEDEKL